MGNNQPATAAVVCVGLALAVVGCGDNVGACGPGTAKDATGYCVPTAGCGPGTKLDLTGQCVPDGSFVCTDGTKFDPTTGKCVLDPNACQDGTVLVGGACVDPTAQLTIDLEEGPEPNGLGIIEASLGPAGTITVPPVGSHFIIHGHLAPFQDANHDGQLDPDVDTYVLDVAGPTLLRLTAAGVHGITAGFVAVPNVAPSDLLASWARFGISLTGATSQRQLYLPRAGEYWIAIADSRTLYQDATGGAIYAAPGPGEYFVTIDQLDAPTPTALTVTGTTATVTDSITEDVKLYTVAMGTGLNEATIGVSSVETRWSVVALDNGAFRSVGTQTMDPIPRPADLLVAGIAPTDTPLIVVDDVYNLSTAPSPYTLTVTTGTAIALSTTGGDATQTVISPTPTRASDYDAYYFDVAVAGDTLGIQITWNHPVRGQLVDPSVQIAGHFTGLDATAPTWTTYRGLLRFATPGRYTFVVYDPTGTAGATPLTATTTITQLVPVAVAQGTPTGAQPVDAFGSNPFTYAAGATDPWQTFDSTGSGTGGQLVAWLDPAAAYGRLDRLTTSASPTPQPGEVPSIFEHAYPLAGGPIGRILLDDATPTYYVKVNPAAPTVTTPTFALAFDKRTITDLGTIATGTTATSPNHTLDATTTTAGYFLFRTAVGDPTTITVHPQTTLLVPQFQRVAKDESAIGPTVTNPTGDAVGTFTQLAPGWTALIVTAATPPAVAEMYDVTVHPSPM